VGRCHSLGWAGIGRGWVVGLFLWLLKFQQGIKDFVGGYVGIVILVVVVGEFFVNEVSFYRVKMGSFSLVLQDLYCFLDGAK